MSECNDTYVAFGGGLAIVGSGAAASRARSSKGGGLTSGLKAEVVGQGGAQNFQS